MNEPRWLKRSDVDYLHSRQIERFGGMHGIRDENAIESALARPRNKWLYAEERDLAMLAAAYGYGLAQNHGYVDGNKRVGLVALGIFLRLNGYRLVTEEPAAVRVMLAVASGTLSEEELVDWVRANMQQV